LERVVRSVYTYNSDEVDKKIKVIVNNLSKTRVEDSLSDNNHGEATYYLDGEFVEPIQLQVVLQRRWHQLFSSKNIDDSPAETSTLIDVDMALRELYEEAIHEVEFTK
jgi:hypothetical protein